jgi:site-specific DNA recombinase
MAVALYARVSTTRQADKDLSIPDQLRQMREWCRRQGYSIGQEYVEAGASATDDKRPVFQQMIADATTKPAPFEAIIIHSLSRFFRDSLEFALYERRLTKAGAKLISITQQTSDDPAGEMARRIFSMFDEYQSKENGKHTLRAMKENARQGFFNGSQPPFGFKKEELDQVAAKGKKKRLVIDETEAPTVRRVFELYLHGLNGNEMGSKQIASYFNERGQLLRGAKWARNRVHTILSDTAYMGEYVFNKKHIRTRTAKPESEWVRAALDPIVSPEVFRAVEAKRHQRSPAVTPARIVNSPTLLTGLLRCANCGAGMTLATGKGGRYRYYKCNTRIGQSIGACDTRAVPVEKMDRAVLTALADKVLTPERLKEMLRELKTRLKQAQAGHDDQARVLRRELTELEQATNRLYEAVEKGLLPMDNTLAARAQTLKGRRDSLLMELASVRRSKEVPAAALSAAHVEAFGAVLRARLQEGAGSFPKRYLRQFVSEIRFDGKRLTMSGRTDALLAAALEKKMGTARVPTSGLSWLPDLGSNQGPTD